jgi:hypothetical protein
MLILTGKINMSIPKEKLEKIIPAHYRGGLTGAQEAVEAADMAAAVKLFTEAKIRMADINNWKNICCGVSAEFCLTNQEGTLLHSSPEIGNLIRIDLPGPGLEKGDGYDWERIEAIEGEGSVEEEEQLFAICVRPVKNPLVPKGAVAHLYKADSTSSFILLRSGNIVYAAEEGRNEIPNTEVEKLSDKIRNAVVAFSAMLGLSVPQWKKLVKGILGK